MTQTRRRGLQKASSSRKFRISPSTTSVQRWADKLLSPNALDSHIPPWYLKAVEKAKALQEARTLQKAKSPEQVLTLGGRYNFRPLRSRVAQAEAVKAESPPRRRSRNTKPQLNPLVSIPVQKSTPRYNLRSNVQPRSSPPVHHLLHHRSDGLGITKMPQQNKRRRPADTELQSAATFSDQASTIRPRPQEQVFELVSTSTRQTTSAAVDRRSTGIQKLIELKQHEPQFIFNYSIEQCPQNVRDLCVRLRKAAFHYKNIIPQELQEQIITNHPFEVPPDGIWSLSPTAPEKANQLYQRVEELYLRMTDLNGVHTGIWEAGCYGVIETALRHFEGRVQGDDNLNFRSLTPLTCTSSSILNDLLPYDSTTQLRVKSTRVDLLIGYRSDQEPWKGCLRERKRHGLNPVPLTPLQGQGIELDFIGVIPVEVKNATGDSMDARYQLVLCASGMLQLRQMWATNSKKEAFNPEKPPIVIALSIVGHNWSYYIIFLGKPEPPIPNIIQEPANPLVQREFDLAPRIVLGPFMAGHTMGILPTFQLFHFLMALREWVVKEWAPEAYEELSPAVPAVDLGTPRVAEQSATL